MFLFLFFNFESYSSRRSPLFRLSLRYLFFCFLDYFEDFLLIKDELPRNRYTLPILTFPTYS